MKKRAPLPQEPKPVSLPPEPTRRDFLALAGSGLFIFFPAEAPAESQEPSRLPARQGYPTDFNAYLHIAPDNRVTCLVGKVELGQGNMTALAQLAAEELDVPLDAVEMVMGDTDRCPWDMGTFGSLSIRAFGPVLRGAAAEARAVLLQMAAEHLAQPVAQLQVKDGVVTGGGKSVTYGELVQGRRIERHLEKAPWKPVRSFNIIGKPARRKDALAKVTGKALYAGDVVLPGMLRARIARPPAHGVHFSVGTAGASKIEGARVVADGDMAAALHEHRESAEQALDAFERLSEQLKPGVNEKTIFEHLLKNSPPPQMVAEAGNLAEGEKLSSSVLERTYLNAYVAHATMETHSAIAQVESGKATVWAGTQTPFGLKQQVAQALGMAPENVRVIATYVGGGFGGKSASRQAVEAARLSKATGKPVQVVWDRAEEFFYDTFRPAAVVKIRTGMSGVGRMVMWDYTVYCAGDREAKQFYDIPHQRTLSAGGWGGQPGSLHPFAVGPWRGPSVNTNTFARESQVDILAVQAGVDPLEFRLRHITDPRLRGVLDAAAKQFGWKPGRAHQGRGSGVACALYLGSYVATMAEVTVDRATGHVQVQRVVAAEDHGLTVNPDGARQQMEGSVMMGLGYTLSEGVRFNGGQVLDHNFDSYQIPRFSWLPQIETVLIDDPETPSAGCGEPPIVTMGAVIANAIADAAGVRMLELPMTPARILESLKKGG